MTRAVDPLVGDGLLVIAKEPGWTSHDVVGRVRRIAGTRKVGHAGTLDPMATGVLVVAVNRATRLLTYLVGCDKSYDATIRLGQSSTTDDAEGKICDVGDAGRLAEVDVAVAVRTLTGRIEQVPSAVSAIKVDGRRAYDRVRAGEAVTLDARPVTVSRFDVRELRQKGTLLDLDVSLDVSSGTYIRAIARDLGAALGVGGHLTALRRTRVGRFEIADASTLAQLEEGRASAAEGSSGLPLIPLAAAARASLATRELTAQEAIDLGYGRRIPAAAPGRTEPVAAVAPDGSLVAILDESGPVAAATVVFAAR